MPRVPNLRHAACCVYRALPFKRRKRGRDSSASQGADSEDSALLTVPTSSTPRSLRSTGLPDSSPQTTRAQQQHYPNPGFLGSSSHSTIFRHVSSSTNLMPSSSVADAGRRGGRQLKRDRVPLQRGADVLTRLSDLDVVNLKALIEFWLATGANLPLAEHFVLCCTEAVARLAQEVPNDCDGNGTWATRTADLLLRNTSRPLVVHRNTTVANYLSQMNGDNVRWESTGIFLAAASRAALDIPFFPALYKSEEQRRDIIRDLARLGDDCLEVCLGLDCLNDLQLVLQYENFIVYSQVYGDQSYYSWRRMGDLASSLYALGYHERTDEDTPAIPPFIDQLRKKTLSRIYTGDKSLAIFLGRPPRIVKSYCTLQLPVNDPGFWNQNTNLSRETERPEPADPAPQSPASHILRNTDPINYTADTCCAAVFAFLKEEILGLFRTRDLQCRAEKTIDLRDKVENQWLALPSHFKLHGSLKDCALSPFERDFLVNTKLDYLHTRFLLDLASLRNIAEPDDSLLDTARSMLTLVVEAVVLRNRLVNSGTCLIWKVAFYGLPAAGIVSLALLKVSTIHSIELSHRSEMLQNLTVLVNEIRLGAVAGTEDPNFDLFTQATHTLQSLLDSVMPVNHSQGPAETNLTPADPSLSVDRVGEWAPWANAEPWEFELDFWANLAEHPMLERPRF
ncbi:hypothetical protein E8E14_003000 [Neopestalotiopsis sp. 37M]|nr:hypothetical protein E8E14_003000 [Neopestalotiopsis sp. 37M]